MANRWIEIPSAVLKEARDRKGYSYETMGRLLSVASKTWERYEKDAHVPIALLPKVAEVLELQLDRPDLVPLRVSVGADYDDDPLIEIRDRLRGLEERDVEQQEMMTEILRLAQVEQGTSESDGP